MVSLNFNDFYFFLNPILSLVVMWLFFFKINSNFYNIRTEFYTNINVIKTTSNKPFICIYYKFIIYSIIFIYTLHGKNLIVWFNHFTLTNFTINMFWVFNIVSLGLFFLLNLLTNKNNIYKNIDYLFSLNNLIIFLPFLFCVNTLFTFLFMLELISVILLYKLISSKIWYKNSFKSKYLENTIPQNYINMVFFQYWVTFFSTIFIVYFYINMFLVFGSSDLYLIQFLQTCNQSESFSEEIILYINVSIFLISIFLKLGITPFHLFKVEVYKGIPFISIFFYTTYYFLIFFTFFLFLLLDSLPAMLVYYYLVFVICISIGIIYTIILIFDVSFLKAFFTYSTVINSIGFLITFLTLI